MQAQDNGSERRTRDGYRLLKLDGKEQPIAAWSKQNNLTHATISSRLDNGWTVREALTTLTGMKRRYHE